MIGSLASSHLTQQPAWGRSREFDITTRTVSRHGMTQKTTGDLEEEEDDEEEDEEAGEDEDDDDEDVSNLLLDDLRIMLN